MGHVSSWLNPIHVCQLGQALPKSSQAPADPARVSAWNLQLSIISQILPNLEVAAWGGLEAVEVLGEG